MQFRGDKSDIQPQGIREVLAQDETEDVVPVSREPDTETAVILVSPAPGADPVPVEAPADFIDKIHPIVTQGESN